MERSFQIQQAFSLKKQPDLSTACQTADINKRTSCRNFAPGVLENKAAIGDASWYGKGHNFATFYDPVERAYNMGNHEQSLSDLEALFAYGMTMGKVSNALITPGVYDHEFTFKDPASDADGVDCICTSMIEKMGGEGQYLYSGVVLDKVTLTGGGSDHVKIAYGAMARKRANDVSSLAALTSQSFMKFLRCTFEFGDSDDSPVTAISNQVTGFELSIGQNPTWWPLPGVSEADQTFYSKATIGKQTISGKLTTFISSARRALFDSNEECRLHISCVGANITGGYYRGVTITIPHFHISAMPVQQDRDMMTIDLTFSEESVKKVSTTPPVVVTVRTPIDNSEILVESV